jgi:hypothetical protein
MRRALLLLMLTITACGTTVEDFRKAAPSNQGVDLKGPSASKKAGKLTGDRTRQEVVGDPALMPGVTLLTTFIVNGSVGLTLGVVASIIAQEPASITDAKAVWGPLTQPLWADTFLFTMTQKAGVFTYVLEGRPKESTGNFVTVLSGSHTPALGTSTGDFILDFGASHRLVHPGDALALGRAEVHYQRTAKGDVELKVAFREPDSDYAFSQVKGGDGTFEFVVNSNFDPKSAALEKLSVKSRWQVDGAGRADVTVTGGDAVKQVRFTECWDVALNRLHYTDTLGLVATEGDATTCAFSTASFSSL